MQIKRFFFLLACAFLIHAPAFAQETQNHVMLRLVPEVSHIEDKKEIWIGIEQSIDPEWHTYWRNPGDSGSKPVLNWALPDGFEISDIQWPVPDKIEYGPLANYGYYDRVVLLQKLKIPEEAGNAPINISAEYEILVCQEECIPEYGTLELTLNEGESADNSAYIDTALREIPALMEDWTGTFKEENGQFILKINPDEATNLQAIDLGTVKFFPIDWGLVDNPSPTTAQWDGNDLIITQARGDRPIDKLLSIQGVIAYTSPAGGLQAFEFSAQKSGTIVAPLTLTDAEKTTSFWGAILFALIGGLILNLMPCVFPVLSIKALSLIKMSEHHRGLAQLHGLSYTAGVILSFVLIAGLLIAFQAAGAEIGWGFQLQNPFVVGALALLLLAIALNFAGLYEIRNPFGNVGHSLASDGGLTGSFFTGVLATLVATPCTAPFMAGAIAYALLQPAIVSLTIFAALGLGLALPYLVLSFVPALQKRMPKPGQWMVTFRKILSIPMFLAALWLFWVLSQQINPAPANAHMPEFGAVYSESALDEALATDQPVFVEMTAAWCITCKVNHKIAINIDQTKKLFKDKGVIYLIGDWTNEDPKITEFLQRYGRNGVPIYVYYGPPDLDSGARPDPVVLPQVLTPATVKDFIQGT